MCGLFSFSACCRALERNLRLSATAVPEVRGEAASIARLTTPGKGGEGEGEGEREGGGRGGG